MDDDNEKQQNGVEAELQQQASFIKQPSIIDCQKFFVKVNSKELDEAAKNAKSARLVQLMKQTLAANANGDAAFEEPKYRTRLRKLQETHAAIDRIASKLVPKLETQAKDIETDLNKITAKEKQIVSKIPKVVELYQKHLKEVKAAEEANAAKMATIASLKEEHLKIDEKIENVLSEIDKVTKGINDEGPFKELLRKEKALEDEIQCMSAQIEILRFDVDRKQRKAELKKQSVKT